MLASSLLSLTARSEDHAQIMVTISWVVAFSFDVTNEPGRSFSPFPLSPTTTSTLWAGRIRRFWVHHPEEG